MARVRGPHGAARRERLVGQAFVGVRALADPAARQVDQGPRRLRDRREDGGVTALPRHHGVDRPVVRAQDEVRIVREDVAQPRSHIVVQPGAIRGRLARRDDRRVPDRDTGLALRDLVERVVDRQPDFARLSHGGDLVGLRSRRTQRGIGEHRQAERKHEHRNQDRSDEPHVQLRPPSITFCAHALAPRLRHARRRSTIPYDRTIFVVGSPASHQTAERHRRRPTDQPAAAVSRSALRAARKWWAIASARIGRP